ncbi:phosphatase PAP2 family protein [candidate division KSB1 bacterium]|nr:phosphatase PAP2 family protein [candidate division KSB1 bacterium]
MLQIKTALEKLRSTDHRWKVYVLLGVLVYFIVINQLIHIRPDHVFLALIVLALILCKNRAKRFLIDWSPFIVFWILYDMMRGVADSVRGVINIEAPYHWELTMFGWLFNGKIPAFWFQDWQHIIQGTWYKGVIDVMCANFYTAHFAIPLLIGWIFWHTEDDRRMFYRMVYTLLVLDVLALITFMIYPAAPPWYVMDYGFAQPDPNTSFWGISAGSLINVDKMFGMHFFTTIWDHFNANHFAAIPSLHGAYPVTIATFVFIKFRRFVPLLVFYVVGTWFAAVYLNQHYIVDLMIGAGYGFVAYQIVHRLLIPYAFNGFLTRWEQQRDLEKASKQVQ